jgi:nicotinate-nucleotide pyrophosphorylase (carboxylating)
MGLGTHAASPSMLHQSQETHDLIQRALAEDEAPADITTTLLPPDLTGEAILVAKSPGVLAGVEVALEVFRLVDSSLQCRALTGDGASIHDEQPLAVIKGKLDSILRAERTALNFIQRLSGIATATQTYVAAIAGLPATLVDTRKTVPGWRHLDKYAVRMGGGTNHRMSLADGVLIKDNHIAAMDAWDEGLTELVRRARAQTPAGTKVEVEVESLEQVQKALHAGADILMLDNMDLGTMHQAVALCRGNARTEASGGVTLETVRAVAATGVDLISTGSITHSVIALDIGLDVAPTVPKL